MNQSTPISVNEVINERVDLIKREQTLGKARQIDYSDLYQTEQADSLIDRNPITYKLNNRSKMGLNDTFDT